MTSRYMDESAEAALQEVIAAAKKNTGIDISHSQAVMHLHAAWKASLEGEDPIWQIFGRVKQ